MTDRIRLCIVAIVLTVCCVGRIGLAGHTETTVIAQTHDPKTASTMKLHAEHDARGLSFFVTQTDDNDGDTTTIATWSAKLSGFSNAVISVNNGRVAACIVSPSPEQQIETDNEVRVVCWWQGGIGEEPMGKTIAQSHIVADFALLPLPSGDWAVWIQSQPVEHAASTPLTRIVLAERKEPTVDIGSYRRPDGVTLCHPHPDFAVIVAPRGEWLLSHEMCVNTMSYERRYDVCLRFFLDGGSKLTESCQETGRGPFTCSTIDVEDGALVGSWYAGREAANARWDLRLFGKNVGQGDVQGSVSQAKARCSRIPR